MKPCLIKYQFILLFSLGLSGWYACGNKEKETEHTASSPEEMKQKTTALLRERLSSPSSGDSTLLLQQWPVLQQLYASNQEALLWSAEGRWTAGADSLYALLRSAMYYGLYPADYHADLIREIRQAFDNDSLSRGARKDALLWTRADLALSDGLVRMLKDIRLGKLPNDSISLNKDTAMADAFFLQAVERVRQTGQARAIADSLEPAHWAYQQIKKAIPSFLKQADFRTYTVVPLPAQTGYREALQKRLFEGGYISFDSVKADSVTLAAAVKAFQKERGMQVDGRAGEGTVRMLNLSDEERFARIAISMDKFKKLPAAMPVKYIWVNTAANYLDVVEDGSVEFSSRVICGKPKTRTPLLNSAVSVLITYPQWVPPPSIVSKEILPAVKKNPGYLARKGFSLLDKDGNEVDPYTVDWSKYSKGIPYRVVQGSGDANALGIIKFHFDNKYSVYLHDTNQRYLFGNAMRSLSHGCVRVQEWQVLARYILRNDSLKAGGKYHMIDSMQTWLSNKEKHHIPVRNKMPVYIRYLTCEARNGALAFYDDIYGEDRQLREKYYSGKRLGKSAL